MSNLTPARLAELRALAERATPGPWMLKGDANSLQDWRIPLERWITRVEDVSFGEDEATARYVASVSPDVLVGLLDEIDRLRAALDELATCDHEDDLVGAVSAASERQGAPAEGRGVDLMAALEESVAAAKAARSRRPLRAAGEER